MTNLERYALNGGGESSLNESIEALVSDLERVTAERDDALDEAKAADLHRNLNRRVAGALGLLDERLDAETGEAYLPSWHDMPEQVTALRAEVERMTAANEELRLTLAAEQGRAEGAPSDSWRCSYPGGRMTWSLPFPGTDLPAETNWARAARGARPVMICEVYRNTSGLWALKWPTFPKATTTHDTARAAMLAAKEGA